MRIARSLRGNYLWNAHQCQLLSNRVFGHESRVGRVTLVNMLAQLVYFRQLAWRIPDPGLARCTRNVMWVFGVPGGIASLSAVILSAARLGGLPAVESISGVIFLVAGILWLVLLTDYRRQFLVQAMLAEMLWSKAECGRVPTGPTGPP